MDQFSRETVALSLVYTHFNAGGCRPYDETMTHPGIEPLLPVFNCSIILEGTQWGKVFSHPKKGRRNNLLIVGEDWYGNEISTPCDFTIRSSITYISTPSLLNRRVLQDLPYTGNFFRILANLFSDPLPCLCFLSSKTVCDEAGDAWEQTVHSVGASSSGSRSDKRKSAPAPGEADLNLVELMVKHADTTPEDALSLIEAIRSTEQSATRWQPLIVGHVEKTADRIRREFHEALGDALTKKL